MIRYLGDDRPADQQDWSVNDHARVAKQDRIAELEAEVERLRTEMGTMVAECKGLQDGSQNRDQQARIAELEAENARLRSLTDVMGEALGELTMFFEKSAEPRMRRWNNISAGQRAVIIDKQLAALTRWQEEKDRG